MHLEEYCGDHYFYSRNGARNCRPIRQSPLYPTNTGTHEANERNNVLFPVAYITNYSHCSKTALDGVTKGPWRLVPHLRGKIRSAINIDSQYIYDVNV